MLSQYVEGMKKNVQLFCNLLTFINVQVFMKIK